MLVLPWAWDLVCAGGIRHADIEVTVMKGEVRTHRSLETAGKPGHVGPRGEAPPLIRRPGAKKGAHGPQPLLGFSRETVGRGRVDTLSKLRIGWAEWFQEAMGSRGDPSGLGSWLWGGEGQGEHWHGDE